MHNDYRLEKVREILRPARDIFGLSENEFAYLCDSDPDSGNDSEWYPRGVGPRVQGFLRAAVLLDLYDDLSLLTTPPGSLRDIDPEKARMWELVRSDMEDARVEVEEVLGMYRQRQDTLMRVLDQCRENDKRDGYPEMEI